MKSIITAIALAVACISTPASAMNSWDWANMFRALADFNNSLKPAVPPVVIVAPAPIQYVFPQTGCTASRLSDCSPDDQAAFIAARNAGLGVAPVISVHPIGTIEVEAGGPRGVDCEDKPYIQYKDELKVYGDKATVDQMCQIKSQASLSCDRELIKITLVLKAADIGVDGCADPSSLPLLETGW